MKVQNIEKEILKMSEYKLKETKIEKAVVGAYKKIENAFVDAFLNEDGSMKTGGMAQKATAAYQKMEDAAVGAYKKVEKAFVDAFLEEIKDGEAEGTNDENAPADDNAVSNQDNE